MVETIPFRPPRRKTGGGASDPGDLPVLLRNAEGGIRACSANAMLMLSGALIGDHPVLRDENPMAGVIGHDEFAFASMMLAPAPWVPAEGRFAPRAWSPTDDIYAAEWLQQHGCLVGPDKVPSAVEGVAHRRKFHPVKEYLDGLRWDGIARIDHWLQDRLGAEDTNLVRAIGAKFLIGAVARIYRPGCKADCVLILEGPQGARKSSALAVMGGAWFSDEIAELGSKDASMQTIGVWLLEIAELDSMNRAEVNKIKAFLSRMVDRFRPPYGARLITSPRACVFAGTTNKMNGYLRDETGARRFWPVRVGQIDLAGLKGARDQLWAEARHQFEAGEAWWISDRDLIAELEEALTELQEGDPWEAKILDYIATRQEATIGEILANALYVQTERQTKAEQTRVGNVLTLLRWTRRQRRKGSGRERYYVPPEDWATKPPATAPPERW